MKKAVVVTIILVAVALISWRVYVAFSEGKGPGQGDRNMIVPVEVNPVTQQTVHDIGEFTGSLLPKSLFVVAPKVTGRLEKLMVNIGDLVNNGDLIAVLDSEEYAQQVAQAQAELDVSNANLADAKSTLDIAVREHERAIELQKQKIASATELDAALSRYSAAKAKYEVAEAQIKQREAALEAAKVRLSYTQIRATWDVKDGKEPRTVAERFVDEGTMLRANDPIVSIVDTSMVRAIINVVETDFPEIRIGQPATVTADAYGDKQFTGSVARRAPVLQEESRQARVEIEIANPDRLLAPGMYVRATIRFSEHKNATVVPVTALVRRNGQQGVFKADLKEMKAQFTPVQVGIIDGELAEIIQPELDGMVVTLGQHLLENGVSIAIPDMTSSGLQEQTSTESSAPQGQAAQEGRQ